MRKIGIYYKYNIDDRVFVWNMGKAKEVLILGIEIEYKKGIDIKAYKSIFYKVGYFDNNPKIRNYVESDVYLTKEDLINFKIKELKALNE